jgi:hypothetical protein
MDGLDIVRMIVPPRSSHSTGIDVVRNDVVIVRELSLAERTHTVLGGNLPVHQLPHLGIRPDNLDILEDVGDRQLDGSPFVVMFFLSESVPVRSTPLSGELGIVDFDEVSLFSPD